MKTWAPRNGEAIIPQAPLNLPEPIWEVLYRRGYQDPGQIEDLLAPTLKKMSSPLSLSGAQGAAERLLRAKSTGEKIILYGDFDMDGTPGLALLHHGLRLLGFENLALLQPSRLKDGYGVHPHLVEPLIHQGYSLMLTVDVGITDVEAIHQIRGWGVDVIVTDHHLPKSELPPAFAIVNPNSGVCPSGLGYLCGTGVAFYLLLVLKSEMRSEVSLKPLLDLFTLGTLADMVPLVGDNRRLLRHGIKALENTERPGLRSLINLLNLESITETDVVFKIVPKLNALSRLELGLRPLDLLMETHPQRAEAMAQETLLVNDRRRGLQQKAMVEVERQAKPEKGFVWVWSKDFHQGVVGIIASQIVNQYGVPAFVGALDEEGNITGSARGPEGFNLVERLGRHQDVLVKFGGHAPAAGFEIREERASEFYERLLAETWDAATSRLLYDGEIRLRDLNEGLMVWHDRLRPFGVEFTQPLFLLRSAQVQSKKILKDRHMKLSLRQGPVKAEAIWFNPDPKWLSMDFIDSVDALVLPQRNDYMGQKSIQLEIKELRIGP